MSHLAYVATDDANSFETEYRKLIMGKGRTPLEALLELCSTGSKGGKSRPPNEERIWTDPRDPNAQLVQACKFGDHERVQLLLKSGADPNARFENRTILQILLMMPERLYRGFSKPSSFMEIVRALIHSGAMIDRTAIAFSCAAPAAESLECLQLLMHSVKGEDVQLDFALSVACENGRRDCVKVLLAAGADPNGTPDATPPLYVACQNGRKGCVEELLAARASVHQGPTSGPAAGMATPLSIACQQGHPEVASLLLTARANTMVETVRHAALQAHASPQIGTRLCEQVEKTPLYVACQNGQAVCVELLLNWSRCLSWESNRRCTWEGWPPQLGWPRRPWVLGASDVTAGHPAACGFPALWPPPPPPPPPNVSRSPPCMASQGA